MAPRKEGRLMRNRKKPGRALRRAMRRFEAWRRDPSRGRRIPEKLWELADEAAREDGVSPAAHRLGLDFSTLKRRLKPKRARRPRPARPRPKAEFIEVPQAVLPSGPVCVVEVQDGTGRRLRVEYRNVKAPEIASVARMLWSVRR